MLFTITHLFFSLQLFLLFLRNLQCSSYLTQFSATLRDLHLMGQDERWHTPEQEAKVVATEPVVKPDIPVPHTMLKNGRNLCYFGYFSHPRDLLDVMVCPEAEGL